MKRFLGITLGILTAIGGFVDIGDLVANALVGSRFGMSLAWVVLLGVLGICVFAEMSGRIAAVSGRAVFDLVRERLGPKAGLANLGASFFILAMTVAAEIGGAALALELATGVNYLLWVPAVAFAAWLVMWRVRFETLERVFGLVGLALVIFVVALWQLGPDWGELWRQASRPAPPPDEGLPTYFYYAIALLGGAMTPYEVFFFSSGGVEENWTRRDLSVSRANVLIGFPLGGLLSLAIAACAATVFLPVHVQVESLDQMVLPVALGAGQVGLALVILGVFAATLGATLEVALSSGYSLSQYFGWQWGKRVRPREAARFHATVLIVMIVATALILTSIDPIMVTEYSLVFSAAALPLTYLPVLMISNDRDYMGDKVNGVFSNTLGTVFMILLVVVSIAAIPLMLATKAGQ
ncbi:NRAMP family divalent metal transporter [Nonomuraea angiospora]|uniref:Mn2+/Fe2+ NRAMP family transporter n=1 Tax=Nonomuraea angiospora TaxID=46172 RepID=A0ABR9LS41_9ACTN|nr:divalent metal cation transporter [Nonomuraea angiospora]MBE1583494.1 Mn2+/Fe2+ NRAMP family transporter [Nonomuraea angiospora]MDX3102681.1 divalent metal cation transporter [Nonomuraea angiospora]